MICKYCGKTTPKLFQKEHDECRDIILSEWQEVEKLMFAYESGQITSKEATNQIVPMSSGKYLQIYMWDRVHFKNEIKSTDHLIYSAQFIEAVDEKNRVHMERPGLSYARYPKWESSGKKICEMGVLALTDTGVYLMDTITTFIPYKKIIDVSKGKFLSHKCVKINVKTTSPQGHKYEIWSLDPVEDNIADITFRIIKMMTGIKSAYRP